MSVLERYLGELSTLRQQVALDSLTAVPSGEHPALSFGKAVGRLEGIGLAEQLLNKLLSEQEAEARGVSGRASS